MIFAIIAMVLGTIAYFVMGHIADKASDE